MIRFENVMFECACGNVKQLPESCMPEIVFSGRSNVGKSSLINKLINRKSFARVSATPGKTATINFYNIKKARLVDLPGYGYAKVSLSEKKRWGILVEGYLNSNRNISLIVQIIDIRNGPSKDDINMLDYLNKSGVPFIVVYTKADKLRKMQREERLKELENQLVQIKSIERVTFSAVTGEGLDKIKELICMHI